MKCSSNRSYNLKIWLPLSSFLLFTGLLAGIVWIDYHNALKLAHEQSERTIRDTLKQLQMTLEEDFVKNDLQDVEREISYIDLKSETLAIALIDDQGMVLSSNQWHWRHKPASATLPHFNRERYKRSRDSFRIDLQYHPDSRLYTAYVPVQFPGFRQAIRSVRIGAVYYVRDHSYVESAIWQQIVSNSALIWSLILFALILFYLIQDYFVTQPLNQLLSFIDRIGENRPSAANPLTGSGELMQLGQTLERMHQSLQHTLNTLKHREQKLEVTLQSIGNGVIATDSQGLITRINPIGEQLTGWQSRECIGQPVEKVFNIVHAETHQLISSPVQEVLETRRTVQQFNHTLLSSRTGNSYHIEINAAPILDERGQFHGAVLTFTDITDKYRLRDQLRREKQYLQHILDNSAIAIYTLTPGPQFGEDFKFNFGSARIMELTGFSLHDWQTINNLWLSRIHPDDLAKVKLANQQIITKGKIVQHYRFLHADGNYRWIEDHLTALTNTEGETYELMGIWIDMTETKVAEQKNQMMGLMLDQAINEIHFVDSKTLHFIHVNQGGVNNLGYRLEELINRSVLEVYPEYCSGSYARLIHPLLSGEQSRLHFETTHRRKDGSCYPVEVWLQLYRNTTDSLVAIALDITQRKGHEEKIQRLNNFYATLSRINQAIVQINNEDALFETVCKISAQIDYVKMAWIAKPDCDRHLLYAAAAAGEGLDYLHQQRIPLQADVTLNLCPTSRAFLENRIIVINDFRNDSETTTLQALIERGHGWKSCCAVPITLNRQPYAVLSVYSNQQNFFDSEVLDLLAELGLDLSFALNMYAHEAARRSAEEKLELSAKVFHHSQEAIIIIDNEKKIISVNRGFTRITGYEEHEVLGKKPRLFSTGLHNKNFNRSMWKSLMATDFWQGELVDRKKEGGFYTAWLTITLVRNEDGQIINYIGIFSDITRYKTAKQQIERLAHYDVLTGLPNRLLFKARVDHEILVAERYKKTFALLFIDLDHFKNINDALGHSVGDQVLIEVGKRLVSGVRDEDTVARVGGDEFNIQLMESDWHGAAKAANHIIALMAEPINYENYQLYIKPSIGISLYPENGDNYETLTRNADTALYQAKTQGRNQYQFFTKAMQKQTQRRMEIEHQLRHALERNELKIYFQPQIDTQTHRIKGAEALLRWHHPEWGFVSPSEFIPVAEECGLILSIGDWVLEQSVAHARQWHEDGLPLTVAVNLSLAQFRADTLYEKIKTTLARYRLAPRFLELELTESVAMQNVEMAIEITRQLTELGVEISIDDFGTGYSSLNYLQRFSLHKLKIDQSFTKEMLHNKESENIVDAIISLAKSLNLKTIAEGVENEQQLALFKQKKCDEIQGFYFSRPLPANEFARLIKQRVMPQDAAKLLQPMS
jgi:diguanylate cyclase (GGDEF)-like protein/PAS domain S-box-containing protein